MSGSTLPVDDPHLCREPRCSFTANACRARGWSLSVPKDVLAVIVGLLTSQLALLLTTLYLHRAVAHRAVTMKPRRAFNCRSARLVVYGHQASRVGRSPPPSPARCCRHGGRRSRGGARRGPIGRPSTKTVMDRRRRPGTRCEPPRPRWRPPKRRSGRTKVAPRRRSHNENCWSCLVASAVSAAIQGRRPDEMRTF